MQSAGNVMAFDYGTRRIGVAIGHPRIGQGRGIGIVQVRNGEPDYPAIRQLVDEWRPKHLVLGLPGGNNQPKSPIRTQIFGFGKQLNEQFGLPVSYVDETLSTEESNFRMSQADQKIPKTRKTDERNKRAAGIILESYFSQLQLQCDPPAS